MYGIYTPTINQASVFGKYVNSTVFTLTENNNNPATNNRQNATMNEVIDLLFSI
jgi:hypothetical protein